MVRAGRRSQCYLGQL